MANQINKFRHRLEKGILVVSFSLCLLLFAGCLPVSTNDNSGKNVDVRQQLQEANWLNPPAAIAADVQGIILPHHLLVASFMDKFYSQLAAANSYDQVVILSPNHFGYGYNLIQTSNNIANAPALDTQWIESLEQSKTARIEPADFGKEHGVYVHYPFLRKYFPQATVIPITVKNGTPCEALDKLAKKLDELRNGEKGRTLILASLDFSHYSSEDLASANDRRTIEWLEKGAVADAGGAGLCQESVEMAVSLDTQTPDAVAIDSPGVIYVMRRLMGDAATAITPTTTKPAGRTETRFNLWARTSSSSLMNSVRALDNTSHIFGYYAL
jgi:AmmeMemoRadiSam system protein B